MKLTKLRVTKEASNRLRFLAGRTGLTPNLLCRLGFCLSLADPAIPDPAAFPEEDREFNRYTLLGEYDPLFVALLRQRCHKDGITENELPGAFRAHMNRGIILLQQRIRSVADLGTLVPSVAPEGIREGDAKGQRRPRRNDNRIKRRATSRSLPRGSAPA